jgi:hypothetical protein
MGVRTRLDKLVRDWRTSSPARLHASDDLRRNEPLGKGFNRALKKNIARDISGL